MCTEETKKRKPSIAEAICMTNIEQWTMQYDSEGGVVRSAAIASWRVDESLNVNRCNLLDTILATNRSLSWRATYNTSKFNFCSVRRRRCRWSMRSNGCEAPLQRPASAALCTATTRWRSNVRLVRQQLNCFSQLDLNHLFNIVIAKFHYTDPTRTRPDPHAPARTFFAAKLRWVRAGPVGSV